MFAITPIPFRQVRLAPGFWSERQETNRREALLKQYAMCEATGRFAALRLEWKPGLPQRPHPFWDSDTAKWLEAACYTYALAPDAELRAKIDHVADLLIGAQQVDGYINSYFTSVCPERRWQGLCIDHELYSAGHIFEAGVAHYEATGEDRLLHACCRFADYIASVFGLGEGQIPGYCGHEEIELALIRLAQATGKRAYVDLAAYFINQRGQEPNYFLREHEWPPMGLAYYQAHRPVRQQEEAVGHAVRALYLYSGMVDVARETGDEELWEAVQRLWRNVTQRKLYVTGGVGSIWEHEAFGPDFYLPNEHAYCETCASVALIFWAQRMLQHSGTAEYAAVIERTLHNSALAGMSLDGKRYFYQNPLASLGGHHRQEWFECSCCPSNFSRLLASLGGYLCGTAGDTLLVHQYIPGEVDFTLDHAQGKLRISGGYPWEGRIQLQLALEQPSQGEWEMRLRLPEWTENAQLLLNGEPLPLPALAHGYLSLRRAWRHNDVIELDAPMPIRSLRADPRVLANAGHVALQRGPFIYCVEDADHPDGGVLPLRLPAESVLTAERVKEPLEMFVIQGNAQLLEAPGDSLYGSVPTVTREVALRAVPYFAWNNRAAGAMKVWLPEGDLFTKRGH